MNKSTMAKTGTMGTRALRQKKPHQIRESEIEKELIKQVRTHGGLHRKLRWINARGAPDQFISLNNKVFLVEVKRPGGKPEPHQLREHQRLKAHGIRVLVIDDLKGIDYLLRTAFEET